MLHRKVADGLSYSRAIPEGLEWELEYLVADSFKGHETQNNNQTEC